MTAQMLFFNDFSEKDPHLNAAGNGVLSRYGVFQIIASLRSDARTGMTLYFPFGECCFCHYNI